MATLVDELTHLPSALPANPAHSVRDFALSMTPICQPLSLVDVPARPFEEPEAAHVSLKPLTVVELSFSLAWVGARGPLPLE